MNINEIMNENKLDAVMITSRVNIKYYSKFGGTEATVIITTKGKYIFVDSRYYEIAQQSCPGFEVILIDRATLLQSLNTFLAQENIKRLGFEADQMVVKQYVDLNNALDVNLVGLSLQNTRMIKNNEEIELIKKAVEITDNAYTHLLDFVKVGMSELDVNIELQKFILSQGADGLSFDTIVASGKRGSMPHGVASEKLIEENDFVTLDFGVFYKGYASDMTRSFVVGQTPDEKLVEIYNVVLDAQLKAIEAIKPGVKAMEIDKVARDSITEAGYGEYFTHGLGHAIGLEIHELPYLSKADQTVLKPGMIVTVEPGIYIPELGGIRIEDDILVTESGHEILNKSSKDIIKIG